MRNFLAAGIGVAIISPIPAGCQWYKRMTSFEEIKVLRYLRKHTPTSLADVIQTCMPGVPPDWGKRIIADLEWLGYITVYYGGGEPVALEITSKGLQFTGC